MNYGELNNFLSLIIGLAIIIIGSFTAYIAQKNIFIKKKNR